MKLLENQYLTILSIAALCIVIAGCAERRAGDRASGGPPPEEFTPLIEAGIRKHIQEKTIRDGGYFKLNYEGKELSLKLVRVHTEYLANLGPERHFACVDLVDTRGDVYDVDFFLSGEPGSMVVTETTAHKLNGQPFYTWEQKKDNTWVRVPIEGAAKELLGIIGGEDEFEFRYRAFLPNIKGPARMWLPLPVSDRFQKVTLKSIDAPVGHRVLTEEQHGNKVLFFELGPEAGGKTVDIRYHVERVEKAAYAGDPEEAKKHLVPERLVPITDEFRRTAAEVTKDKPTDIMKARALYDHVIDHLRYAKFGKGWGKGDAQFACDARKGNCTDYHAYFIALARAVNIPARFAIGAGIPSSRDNGGVNGYHCWVEFYADGKWWPVDISEADKYSALSTYYFGHHPANRVEFTRGRDLVVTPGPASGPINFLAYPVLEVNGKPVKAPIKFTFTRSRSQA